MAAASDPIEPYRQSLRQHGSGFDVTLWASPRSQRLRFQVMTQMVFMTGKRVLDAGCSRGDFAAYLVERDIAYDRYIGIDGMAEVIDVARKRHLPRCRFEHGDLLGDPSLFRLGDPHIVCISGTLNTMNDEQALRLLDSAWAGAGECLIFNFLSGRPGPDAPPQQPPARRIDPLMLLDWALARTSNVVLRQDYFKAGHDATILMRR